MKLPVALWRLAKCASTTGVLLARRRLHLPRTNVGRRLDFADGTSARVYRETVVERPPLEQPVVLVVQFRMRVLNGRVGQAYFRVVSLLNTPLFAGFPGFANKLWMAADEEGRYRGLYEWDDAGLAHDYVRALWWPLAVVSRLDSIRYRVLPGRRRDDVLGGGESMATGDGWWQPVGSTPAWT
ncbi:hypothetical protein [Nakamurella panacisegetis]|nr:hypothetical protein [Nakamurella panacisegetis]